FSLPLFAFWALSEDGVPVKVRAFRVCFTLLAALCMGIIILVRQRILDRELVRLLEHSRAAFEELTRLQAQILQSEKLASLRQLAGRWSHQLKNPHPPHAGLSGSVSGSPIECTTAATRHKNWSIRTAHPLAGSQPDQLRSPGPCAQDST